MNGGAVLLLSGFLSLMLFLVQRTEAKRRRLAIILMFIVAFLTVYWANYRGLSGEIAFAIGAALLLNFLFWALIGRYNPVGDSDKRIQVLGMDD
jgi:hypothetical protein